MPPMTLAKEPHPLTLPELQLPQRYAESFWISVDRVVLLRKARNVGIIGMDILAEK